MVCLFLDMWVFKDPRDPEKIHFKPYRKARNHRERISWISYHPIDVKRGTFLGEMSRLASLCSSRELYNDAIYDLQQLYKVRGYPPGLLSEWTRSNLSVKWEKRYDSADMHIGEHATFAVLKLEFNPVLNYLNAKELGETIITAWRESMEMWNRGDLPKCYTEDWQAGRQVLLDNVSLSNGLDGSVLSSKGEGSPLKLPDVTKLNSLMKVRRIISRKRTKNLFDLANTWKRMVLASTDENLFNDLNEYGPGLSAESEEDFGTSWDDAVPGSELSAGVKHQSMEDQEVSSSKRARRDELPEAYARVKSAWGPGGISDVVVGSSALRGSITHFLRKVDRKGKHKQL